MAINVFRSNSLADLSCFSIFDLNRNRVVQYLERRIDRTGIIYSPFIVLLNESSMNDASDPKSYSKCRLCLLSGL